MSDIFEEVDEEVRREQLRKLWDKYSLLVYVLAALIVLSVAGWRGYEWYEERQAQAAGAQFDAAMRLLTEGKTAEADTAFRALAGSAPSGYRMLARFADASASAATDKPGAVAAFDAIAADTSVLAPLRDLARIRAGLILVDTAPYADLAQRLEPLAVPQGAYRHSARELSALAAWRIGDRDAAKRWNEALLTDDGAPTSLRSRAEMLRDVMATQAAKAN